MKTKTTLLIMLLLMGTASIFAFDYTYKGVTFTCKVKGNGVIITKFDRNATKVTVPAKVADGKAVYDVLEVSTFSNGDNYSARQLVLEEGIKRIASWSFVEFRWLTEVTLPSSLTYVGKRAFRTNTTDVNFNLPSSIDVADIRQGKELTLFEINKPNPRSNNLTNNPSSRQKFSTFAKDRLEDMMKRWQTKKPYESVAQYKARVTEEKRTERMNEYVEDLKAEFISMYAPKSITTRLSDYDSEYGVYVVETDSYGKIYAQVPKAEALRFRQNYPSVDVEPHFGVKGDTLTIVSCDFVLNGKTYTNMASHEENGMLDYHFELPEFDYDLALNSQSVPDRNPDVKDHSIDMDIPVTKVNNDKTFVLIIGNENYKRIAKVPYAKNDAKVFANYCQKTLGIPQKNIKIYEDATVNDMRHAINTLSNTLKAFKGEARALVYYSGHGYPDEATRMPYLMPVDGFASDVAASGYNLNEVYDALAGAPSELTLFLLDACFSGTQRNGDMVLAAKGVAMAARTTIPEGNVLVFSASKGSETAFVDKEHGHGRFTYYLLKHLHDTKGDTTIGSMVDYVKDRVLKASVTENDGKTQTPISAPSPSLDESWKEMKLRK